MIILVTGWFDKYDHNGHRTGEQEFVASHGYDTETDRNVIVSCDHPSKLGAVFYPSLQEWVIV